MVHTGHEEGIDSEWDSIHCSPPHTFTTRGSVIVTKPPVYFWQVGGDSHGNRKNVKIHTDSNPGSGLKTTCCPIVFQLFLMKGFSRKPNVLCLIYDEVNRHEVW